jgi:hypothetical protein
MLRPTRTVTILLAALPTTAGSVGITSKALPSSAPEEVGLSSQRLARMDLVRFTVRN